jgi:hypothetical protein
MMLIWSRSKYALGVVEMGLKGSSTVVGGAVVDFPLLISKFL